MGLPYLPRRSPTFAFIVHPRSEEDIFRARCLSLLRQLSTSDADYVARVCALPPTVVGEVLFGFSPFRGDIISIPCLPADVASARGKQEILRAAHIVTDRGAKVIGLGALTAPATGGGAWLVEQLPAGVTVTNGNGYTAAVLRRNILEAVDALALERAPRVAVVGCTGSVGVVVTQLLANAGFDLILIGRTTAKVKQQFGDVAPRALFSQELTDVAAADIILTLTAAPRARLRPGVIRAGAIVIDAAEPANVPENEAETWRHATVVRGGRVRIPGYHCTYDFGAKDPTETFACLAETFLFAREGIHQHSVGTPSPQFAERLERAARRHGVQPIGLNLTASGIGAQSERTMQGRAIETPSAPAILREDAS
jgi:fatty aldehyde-generating acyl-ACP reductase